MTPYLDALRRTVLPTPHHPTCHPVSPATVAYVRAFHRFHTHTRTHLPYTRASPPHCRTQPVDSLPLGVGLPLDYATPPALTHHTRAALRQDDDDIYGHTHRRTLPRCYANYAT